MKLRQLIVFLIRLMNTPIRASAGAGEEIASIIESLMALVIIFALIYAASGEWGTFAFIILVGSGMVFASNFLRR